MKTKLLHGLAALAAFGLAACSSEDVIPDGPGDDRLDEDRSVYVNIAIRGDIASIGTRTGSSDGNPAETIPGTGDEPSTSDFAQGAGNESKVTNAYFVFYDENKKLVGNIVNVKLGNPQIATSPTNTVESFYYNVVKVDLYKGQENPSYVMCYINPTSPNDLHASLDDIQTITRQEVKTGSGESELFPMSNSVYYPNAKNSTLPSDNDVPCIAAPIDKDTQVFDTQAEADAVAKNPTSELAIDIYVERYAAKLKFKSKKAEDYTTTTLSSDGKKDIKVTLSFETKGWVLNAESEKIYAVKSFRKKGEGNVILPDNFTYSGLNDIINEGIETGKWIWNNADYHRSYWAISPAYFTEKYPEVASDLTTISVNQKYYSYNEIINGKSNGTGVGNGTVDYDVYYARETTVGKDAIKSANPAAAVASVVLAGQYKITVDGITGGEDGNPKPLEGQTFFTYLTNKDNKPQLFFDSKENSKEAESKVNNTMSIHKRLILQQTVLYKKITDEKGQVSYERYNPEGNEQDLKGLVAATEVKHPDKEVIVKANGAGAKLADRQYTLQLKSVEAAKNIYVASGNGFNQVIAAMEKNEAEGTNNRISFEYANATIMNSVGYAVKYDEGLGFFNIPVKHYGWYRDGNSQNDDIFTWKNVNVGDFGIVRNHVYDIEVSKITGLATGIAGKDTPIIPPADTKEKFMVYRVKILKWALVPKQTVIL